MRGLQPVLLPRPMRMALPEAPIQAHPRQFRHHLSALVLVLLLALLVMTFHRQLMGVAVVPWGM